MRGSQWVFFIPYGNKIGQKNFAKTVEVGVPFKDIETYLKDDNKIALQNLDILRVWGNHSGTRKGWELMEPKDIVLFYKSGEFTHAAKVLHKIDNENLSKNLWPNFPKGKPWRHIYFIKDLTEVKISWDLVKKYSDYSPGYFVRGFTVAKPKAINRLIKEYSSLENFVETHRTSKVINDFNVRGSRNWWIEKSKVKGRRENQTGNYSLGKALWCPQRRSDGRRVRSYENMKKLKKGDVILHLIDNKAIVGISIVEKECNPNFFCIPGTPWGDGTGKRPAFLVTLKDYQEFKNPIDRSDILSNGELKNDLIQLLNDHYLFYNKKMELNQGAYLTKLPPALVKIINDVFKEKMGKTCHIILLTPSIQYPYRQRQRNSLKSSREILKI